MAEESFGPDVLDDLRRRGHDLEIAPAWTIGRLVAARATRTACCAPQRRRG